MIKVEHIDVFNFEGAIRGMRNPLNSWDRSDSEEKYWCTDLGPDEKPHYCNHCTYDMCHPYEGEPVFVVGENDLGLMRKLYKAGSEHRKYLRQIMISMDITAPLYWWKEMDQYKVGTTTNSCSTMHTIHKKEFELDDFSTEHLNDFNKRHFKDTIDLLNANRDQYLNTKNKDDWWQLIQLLPSSYNQRRTITMNYENVVTMIKQRTGHKLTEWEDFCAILKELPYIKEIMEA